MYIIHTPTRMCIHAYTLTNTYICVCIYMCVCVFRGVYACIVRLKCRLDMETTRYTGHTIHTKWMVKFYLFMKIHTLRVLAYYLHHDSVQYVFKWYLSSPRIRYQWFLWMVQEDVVPSTFQATPPGYTFRLRLQAAPSGYTLTVILNKSRSTSVCVCV